MNTPIDRLHGITYSIRHIRTRFLILIYCAPDAFAATWVAGYFQLLLIHSKARDRALLMRLNINSLLATAHDIVLALISQHETVATAVAGQILVPRQRHGLT